MQIPGSYYPEVSLASQPSLVGEWAPGQSQKDPVFFEILSQKAKWVAPEKHQGLPTLHIPQAPEHIQIYVICIYTHSIYT